MKLLSGSSEETEEIGYRLGRKLKAGDVVGLYGDLGAGKTTMVKGIARAFGIERRDVTSASFTIIAEYRCTPPFFHIDLYRVGEGEDLDNTGIWECIGGGSVSVIEWAERLGKPPVRDYIKVIIEDGEKDVREITIEGVDEKDWNNL
ncbi:MAG: tRNA (adenosine(37)-N6)-threonylcarbamoyltransferase complex ATPase subunit type 1 TsaE [Candidatus Sulfobium sp.]